MPDNVLSSFQTLSHFNFHNNPTIPGSIITPGGIIPKLQIRKQRQKVCKYLPNVTELVSARGWI